MARHRHLIVANLGNPSLEFEAHGGGGDKHRPSVDNRTAHAAILRADLGRLAEEAASASAEQAEAGVPVKNRGITVAVASRVGEPLVTGDSRRASSGGMQLLSVKRGADVAASRGSDKAVYFMSTKSIEGLGDSLDEYEGWEAPDWPGGNEPGADEGGRRPTNFWLFESTASLRPARVEDLWTDALESFPRERGQVEWEIWVRESMVDAFEAAIVQLGIQTSGQPTRFLDIVVYNGITSKATLGRLIARSAAVVELRAASSFIADHADLPPTERLEQIRAMAGRVVPAPPAAPWVSLLDTGVNPASALLATSLPPGRCRAVVDSWNRFDPDGHGSKMAGVALYGDLETHADASGPIQLETALESIAVFSPGDPVRIPARDAIIRGVTTAEADAPHGRVYCLAATAIGEPEDGRPTSTSGTLDGLAYNDGTATRLFCVAVGNVHTTGTEPYQVARYLTLNEEDGIQSPAQALNVLSVGALTHKCSGPAPVADAGNLSPRSRTAQAWDGRSHKPDIVMEGGNHGIDPDGTTSRPHGPDMVATTSNNPNRITLTGDTSAACAAAARLAGRVLARYPAMRAETVRGLLVHGADWTPAMRVRRQVLIDNGADELDATLAVLDCYGWGVPDEERIFWSADNALTLIAQDELTPYKENNRRSMVLKEMKSFALPWPDEALAELGATEVELRCTLSYFIQPDIHSASLQRPQFYPSHGLRFDLQRFEESAERAMRRVNRAVVTSDPNVDDEGWLLGWKKRIRGTLHHDIWRGPAYQLAGRGAINVTPVRGWWALSARHQKAEVAVPFSLIVSIRTPETANDLVAETRSLIETRNINLVDIPALVSV